MKRTLALILALMMIMALVSCGGTPGTSSTPSSTPDKSDATTSTPVTPDKPAEPKIANRYQSNESFTLFPQASTSQYDEYMIYRINAKLYNYLPVDGKAVLSPELADGEPIDINGDGKTWNVKIKKEAQWENGDPINADTFIFAFQIALDPKLYYTGGTAVADNLIKIVNATEYHTQGQEGKTPVAWEDVGVKKVDEYTIQVQVVNPVSVLDVMRHLNNKPLMPIHEGLYKQLTAADGTTTYGTSVDTILSCGPFRLTEWVNEALHMYEKNETYVLADMVKLDGIKENVIKDANTRLQMFENGELDYYVLSTAAREKYADDPRVVFYPSRTTTVIEVMDQSTENPILGNYNFRLAMYYGMNREELSKLGNYMPNLSTISPTAGGMADGTLYQTVAYANNTYLAQDTMGYDPELAKQYFDKALQEENLSSVEVTFLATEGGYSRMAEYLQEAWPKLFGEDKIKVNIDIQTTGVISEIRNTWKDNPSAYDLCFMGSGPAIADFNPAVSSRYFNTMQAKRNAPHINDEADALFVASTTAATPEEKYELAMEYEKALQKTMTAIPVVHGASFCIFTDRYVSPIDPENYDVNGGWCHEYADIVQ